MSRTLRCAIYTRKSSEEGLEQGFNSLHAQREACEAYVLSQAGEGWSALATTYDDGGFSGGSMDRPGVQALLADVRRGHVDIVVVYKVDRLTRSLADFARIVELFDEHQVSFVSVTQAFNTTTSMGRLTLNVLLSFAQFEREVTGERIRDKIAASKAKGLWMGGRPPLGYDPDDRKLVINAAEAETVRYIFRGYLELGTVAKLETDLRTRGITSKRWINKRGELTGGAHLSRGAIYHLLANPVYRGAIRHRDKCVEDAHPAIVDAELWVAVQTKLKLSAGERPTTPRAAADILLRGLLFDDRGNPMRPLHTTRGSKRYRYYASAPPSGAGAPVGSLPRIAVGALDEFLLDRTACVLADGWLPDGDAAARLAAAVRKVVLGEDRIVVSLRMEACVAAPRLEAPGTCQVSGEGIEIAIPIRLKHRQGAILISPPDGPDPSAGISRALVRAVSMARVWSEDIAEGRMPNLKALAKAEGLCEHYAAKLLPLAWLAPDLVELIVDGRQPRALSLGVLTKHALPADWDEQRSLFARLG